MVKDHGYWFPWLLPCPPVQYSSPCDLFGTDAAIVSSLSPEMIRGISFQDDHRQDLYALGTLAILALGCTESPETTNDEGRIEAQACNRLLVCSIQSSEIEPFLHQVAAINRLIQTIERYTHVEQTARPATAKELRVACVEAIEATNPLTLAQRYIQADNLRGALEILEWGFKHIGENWQERRLAADIYQRFGDLHQAIKHLDRAISVAPETEVIDLIRHRATLHWHLLKLSPSLALADPDPEGDRLLQDVSLLKQFPGTVVPKNTYHKMAAYVYRRRQDLAAAAQELYEAADLEQADMEALWLYAECLSDLGDSGAAWQVALEGMRRLERMITVEMIGRKEAQLWQEKFNSLLS